MKKLVATLLAVSMGLSLTACGGTNTGGSTAGDGNTGDGSDTKQLQKLGYVSAAWNDDYCKRLNDALVEMGPEYGFEVEALNASPNGMMDVTGYIEAIDALAQKNLSAILIQPLFSAPDMCMQFQEKGVKVGFVNIVPQISDTSKDLEFYYAGSSEETIGAQLAEAMSAGLKNGAKVCQLCLPYGQDNAAGRKKGFEDWMTANRPDVQILETNYIEKIDPTNAQSIFEDWLQKYGVGGFDGCATQGSMLTQGVVESMKSNGLDATNFCLGGISASSSDWILEGVEYCELFQDPKVEAATALDMMRKMVDGTTAELKLLEGGPIPNFVSVPMVTLTAENAAEYSSEALQSK